MSTSELVNIAVNICWPPMSMLIWTWIARRQPLWWRKPLALASAAIGDMVGSSAQGYWISIGISVGYVVVAIVIWWWRSGKGKRAAAMLGAKSRALRDALVRKVRESAKPRPVLKPAPGGAR